MTAPAGESLTVAEAAAWLNPVITPRQLGELIGTLGIRPVGRRPPGQRPGRPPATYNAAELMRLHAAVAPWLASLGCRV